jgi:hypothetical protein
MLLDRPKNDDIVYCTVAFTRQMLLAAVDPEVIIDLELASVKREILRYLRDNQRDPSS